MENKKVLHISQALGGVQTYFEKYLGHSCFSKFQFVIIAPSEDRLADFCRSNTITYYPLLINRNVNLFKDLRSLIKLIRYIRKENPAVVHTHSAKGGFLGRIAAKACGKKVIYTPHAFSYLSFTGYKRILFYYLEFIARRWTNILLAVSYSEASRAIFDVGFKKNLVKVIVNSIDINNSIVREDYSRCITIGMIARLTHQKNPLLFLLIVKSLHSKYPNLKFSILGAGLHDHLISEIQNYITEHDLAETVELQSWGNHETSDSYLNKVDIYLMTSNFEGLPYSLLEAMAKGIPCVVSNVDGNSDVIQNNENGFACKNCDDFCEKIERLVNNESERRRLGQAAFEYVKLKHGITEAADKLENVYTGLCNNS